MTVLVINFTFLATLVLIGIAQGVPNFDGPAVYQVTKPVDHGEGPTWDGRKNVLYFVDLHEGKIFCYNYTRKSLHNITLYGDVTPVVPSEKDPNLLLVGVNRSIVAVEWDGRNHYRTKKVLTTVADDKPTSRFNDGKADKEGRLWFGTMGYESPDGNLTKDNGALFKITRSNLRNPEYMLDPVDISNGLAWNKANDKFYYIDTPKLKITSFDYDNEKGEISNPQTVFDLRKKRISGSPDGMTIDKDDNLWIALYGGGSVIKIDPRTGDLLQRVAVPATYVTSVMWGGPDLDILFVTTSRLLLNGKQRQEQPAAGSVFAITGTGSSGFPVFNADIIDQI